MWLFRWTKMKSWGSNVWLSLLMTYLFRPLLFHVGILIWLSLVGLWTCVNDFIKKKKTLSYVLVQHCGYKQHLLTEWSHLLSVTRAEQKHTPAVQADVPSIITRLFFSSLSQHTPIHRSWKVTTAWIHLRVLFSTDLTSLLFYFSLSHRTTALPNALIT